MLRLAAELRRMNSVLVPPAGLVPVYQQPDVLLPIKALLVSLETTEQKRCENCDYKGFDFGTKWQNT